MTNNLIQTGFDKFLARLDAEDRHQAGLKYESLRRRLIKFFEWRNCEMPEELTDIVFDRITRKITEGEEIQNIQAYSATIAQFVFKEYLRGNERQNQLIEGSPQIQNLKQKEVDEVDETQLHREKCLEKCLAEFSHENRRLIMAYYDTDEATMIATRKRLAEQMNISLNILRIRVCRLKAKLEDCTLNCCEIGESGES
jgi:DNA-directed RNA polymerase specialized sigma24 family protein